MKRIAFFGPLPPDHTGISDYDTELLPLLRQFYDIDVFVDQRPAPAGYSAFPHETFYFKQKAQSYDLILYQMGNSLFHEYMYSYLFSYPGAVVFHDYCLHQSRATMLLRKILVNEFVAEGKMAHPESGAKLANAVVSGASSELLFSYFPLNRLILSSALSAGAHTDILVRKLNETETPVVKIPMAVVTEQLRFERDPFPGKLVIASFGLATRQKRILQVLPALHGLLRSYNDIVYLIVGEVSGNFATALSAEIEKWNLQKMVVVTGHVQRDEFIKYINRADIVANLRYPSAGEMSSSLLRVLQAGKPTLISRLHYTEEIPADTVLRIPTDREEEAIYYALQKLIARPQLRDDLGSAARRYVEAHHRPGQMTDAYRELIEKGLERKSTFRAPDLPLHLRSARQILYEYIRRSEDEKTVSYLETYCSF